jgi:photosystem II stability/assembly factor-like uncharacterized protein
MVPIKRLFYLSIILFSAALHTSAAHAQWVQTNGPYGGSVFSITHLGNNIFIVTTGGVFESTDQGSSWRLSKNGFPDGDYATGLTTCGSDIFAGTYNHGVFRSTDSGISWISASVGLPDSFYVSRLEASNLLVFASNSYYFYVSSNHGNDWRLMDTNLTKFSSPRTMYSLDSITYVAGSWITQTTDDGLSWGVTAIPPSDSTWDITSMANIGEIMFAGDGQLGVLRSTDHGKTWDRFTNGLPNHPQFTWLASIGNVLLAGMDNGGVYRSIDSARSWQLASTNLPVGGSMALESNGTELLAGFYELGIFRSFDSGKTWTECSQGLGNPIVNVITSIDDTTIVGTNTGVFLSTDIGRSWQPESNGLTDYNIGSLFVDGDSLYAGLRDMSYPPLFVSADRGRNWSSHDQNFGLDNMNIRAILRSHANLIACGEPLGGYGIFTLTGTQPEWFESGVNIGPRTISFYGMINIGERLIAATNNLTYISTNDGFTWTQSANGLDDSLQIVVSAIGSAGKITFIYCSTDSFKTNLGIYSSTDYGLSWYPTSDTAFPSRGKVTCFTSTGDTLFAATDSLGIFLTTDDGAHWINENLGLGDSNVLSLAVQGNELLAGTASSGVWRRPLAEMIPSLRVASTNQPSEAISVYPDPASSIVTVSCPDIIGTTEASLISENGATVWHRAITTNGQPFLLDLSGVANGAYRMNFVNGGITQSTKIVLQR